MERHFPLDRLAAALRSDGVTVHILDGAQGRSARNFSDVGYYRGCQAVVQHHTVSSGQYPHSDIDYILHGKGEGYVIANAYTWRVTVPTVTLIASGPTYTEGRGGPHGIIPENRANDVSFSNEIANWGDGVQSYPWAQQHAAKLLAYHACKIAADIWDWPDDPFNRFRLFGHFEWTSRKVDPLGPSAWHIPGRSWDMDRHRRDVAGLDTKPPPPPPPPPPPAPSGLVYVVRPTDTTIWSICNRLYKLGAGSGNADAVVEERDGNTTIRSGDVLAIPGKVTRNPSFGLDYGVRHVVQQGETLYGIADDVYVEGTGNGNFDALVRAYPGADPNKIHPGELIPVPGKVVR
jgi:LysM repeat protein